MSWHRRLDHPSFSYLKQLSPSLFKNKNPLMFQCEVCQLFKHHHVYFPTRPYKESRTFALINTDIWGPSCMVTLTGTRWFITFIDDHTRVC